MVKNQVPGWNKTDKDKVIFPGVWRGDCLILRRGGEELREKWGPKKYGTFWDTLGSPGPLVVEPLLWNPYSLLKKNLPKPQKGTQGVRFSGVRNRRI